MEPVTKTVNSKDGLAPIVGWYNGSPSLSNRTQTEVTTTPRSAVSSGIGRDTSSSTSSLSGSDYSQSLSSSGDRNSISKTPRAVVTNNPIYDGNLLQVKLNNEKDSVCSTAAEDSEDEDEDDEDGRRNSKSKAPDGGWGWVVVFASLIISMVADGISFSFGLLFIEFLKYFKESKSTTSWIGSLFMAVPLLSGPIGSALVDRYGCRMMTMIGGVIAGLGFVMSAFAESIEVMYLTFGVLAGLGLGFCYVTAVVSIAYWFDKKRTLATGLGACGTGIGTFVYAPMTQFFIEEFGWRGTILMLAGSFFNMCVCGALMRDPEWWAQEQNKNNMKSRIGTSSSVDTISARSGDSKIPNLDEIRKMLKSGYTGEYLINPEPVRVVHTQSNHNGDQPQPPYRSVVNLPTFILQSEKVSPEGFFVIRLMAVVWFSVYSPTLPQTEFRTRRRSLGFTLNNVPLEVLESLSTKRRMYDVILENYPSLLMCRSMSDGKLGSEPPSCRVPVTVRRVKETEPSSPPPPPLALPPPAQDPASVPLLESRKKPPVINPTSPSGIKKHQIMCHVTTGSPHYLNKIRVHRNSVMYRGAMLNIHKYRLRASSCPDIFRNSMTTIAKEKEERWYTDMLDLLQDIADFSMFLELHFLFMSLSTILFFIWFIVPYFYLAEHMVRSGYTEQDASNLLSVIGLANFFGMIMLGWAGDQPWCNVTKSYAALQVLCGISTIAMPLLTFNYWLLCITVALFGLFVASNFSFTPAILVQLIPLERFTTAYGLILLCQGIGNLTGPPVGGLLFDITQKWDMSFYMAGIWIIVAGLLTALIPNTRNRKLWGSGSLEMDTEREKYSNA